MKQKSAPASERIEKLERAVKAGLWLRKQIDDPVPFSKMLMVPREAVERYDAAIKELK